MSERIVFRSGESLVGGGPPGTAAEPEVVIGELDGPVGTAQAAIANGVLDAVRAGDIPKDKVNDLGIICSVWLNPSVVDDENLDHKVLFDIHRKAMAQAIHKAMRHGLAVDVE